MQLLVHVNQIRQLQLSIGLQLRLARELEGLNLFQIFIAYGDIGVRALNIGTRAFSA